MIQNTFLISIRNYIKSQGIGEKIGVFRIYNSNLTIL
jgi:hypothetical protein